MEPKSRKAWQLMWKKPPDSLSRGPEITKTVSKNGTLTYYEGTLVYENSLENVLIQEFNSSAQTVEHHLNNELNIFSSLQKLNIKTGLLGYFYCEEGTKSVMVYNSYNKSLCSVSLADEETKVGYLFQLARILHKMNRSGICLGLIYPSFIFIDKKNEIILGTLFFACWNNEKKEKKIYTMKLALIKSEFFAPEINIIKQINEPLTPKQFSALHLVFAEVYSFGLVACFLFGLQFEEDSFSNSQETLNYILGIAKPTYHILNNPKINSLSQRINDQNYVSCLQLCLAYRRSSRANYELLCEWLQPHIETKKESQNNDQSITTKHNLKEILIDFEMMFRHLFKEKDSSCLNPQLVQQRVIEFENELENKYRTLFNVEIQSSVLETIADSFLQSQCSTNNIKARDGIIHFIWAFVNDIKASLIFAERFVRNIESQSSLPFYKRILSKIVYADPILQDFFLVGVSLQNYRNDWSFFFPELQHHFFRQFVKLVDLKDFCAECLKILMHPKILMILNQYSQSPENLKSDIQVALERTYLTEMQPSLYGLNTYNKNIFIDYYGADLFSIEPRFKVAIFLTIFHELAHFLRRVDCKKFINVKCRRTPKGDYIRNFEDSVDNKKTENQLGDTRGEAGSQIERDLLGVNFLTINDEAAEYFLRCEFEDNQFTDKLEQLNKIPGPSVGMSKTSSRICFEGRRCGVSGKFK